MMIDRISEVAKAYLAKHPEYEERGRARLNCILETGFADWYAWSIENWGTKWDSFRYREVAADPFAFRFETAWSFPTPIFEALAAKYPTLTFDVMAFDEGWNFACEGQFGSEVRKPFETVEATDELYEAVYGQAPEREDA